MCRLAGYLKQWRSGLMRPTMSWILAHTSCMLPHH